MFIFHFNINGMYISCVRNRNTISIFVNYIPTAFFTIWRNVTIFNILENTLMKISNIVVVRLVPLTENFVAYNFFPRRLIYCLVKNQFNRINDIFIKAL